MKLNFRIKVLLIWIMYCVLTGSIGWYLHDQSLYQPYVVWIIGSLLFHTLTGVLILMLCVMFTTLINSIYKINTHTDKYLYIITSIMMVSLIALDFLFGLEL
jgi:membrane protein insertase Oxa1/YidC/SpoIIIJ